LSVTKGRKGGRGGTFCQPPLVKRVGERQALIGQKAKTVATPRKKETDFKQKGRSRNKGARGKMEHCADGCPNEKEKTGEVN